MKNGGFTLTEVMVGVIVFGVVTVAGFYLFVSGSSFIERARRKNTALEVASSRMELIKGATDYALITGTGETKTVNVGTGIDYNYKISVTEVDDGHKEIEVEVDWELSDGNKQDLRLNTIIHRW